MIELTQAYRDAGLQARIFAFASVFNGNRREKSGVREGACPIATIREVATRQIRMVVSKARRALPAS
jgi:hypothetical protein